MRNKLATLCASVFLLGAVTINCAFAQGQNEGGGRLTGTWDAAVTIVNCQTGETITNFQSTANFNQGGTFTGITSGTPPANRTPEVGVWRHVNKNNYLFRFKAYLFNPAGVAIAYQVVTHQLELGDDNLSYTSAGGVQIFAMNGVQIGTGCSNGVGSRFTL
jgi:hypothetical protein